MSKRVDGRKEFSGLRTQEEVSGFKFQVSGFRFEVSGLRFKRAVKSS